MQESTVSDVQLVRAVLEGRRDAFAQLVGRYERLVLAVALEKLPEHDARDAAQEAFVTAYRKLGSLRDPAAFSGWIATTVRRLAARRAATDRRHVSLDSVGDVADPAPTDGNGDHQAVRRAVVALPEQERQVVALRYFADMSLREIAAATGRGVGTVSKQLSRGRERLRRRLGEAER